MAVVPDEELCDPPSLHLDDPPGSHTPPTPLVDGAFVLSLDTVWYARVLLLFSATATTDTGFKSYDCAHVSTSETYDDPENGYYLHYINITIICSYDYCSNYADFFVLQDG